ncbi:patatin-like phospholipase family protein [Chitinophagaceae bacterium MMS25-I14]
MSFEQKNTGLPPTATPFENIALAFSGGGFRAASFSLGVLSYLDAVKLNDGTPLLHKVTYISSASGGTIANAMYALHSTSGKPFGTFYKLLYERLQGIDLLDVVMKKLNADHIWKEHPDKTRNLINAFALAYDEVLLNGKTLGDLAIAPGLTHLQEVCFNSTEFYRGLLFRQAVKMQPDTKPDKDFRYGNFIINLSKEAAAKLKLADILAASSCFPAGFEPIIFPDDFANSHINISTLLQNLSVQPQELDWQELERLYTREQIDTVLSTLPHPVQVTALQEALQKLPLRTGFKAGMMDGGITDNQGLDSMMDANERRVSGHTDFKPFDLMLVNDVGSHFMDPYVLPDDKKKYTGIYGITVNTIMIWSILIAIAAIGGLSYSFLCDGSSTGAKLLAIFSSLLLLIFGGLFVLLQFIKQYVSGEIRDGKGLDLSRTFSPFITDKLFGYLGRTPIGVIVRMLRERGSSILILNNDVFLKRIRYLLYNSFFDAKHWSYRTKSNHVYDLAYINDTNRARNDFPDLEPSDNLKTTAQSAFEMGTTLWFDTSGQQEHKEAVLIACGQFTTCYNLLLYIERLKTSNTYASLDLLYKKRTDDLYALLSEEYARFKQDPFWLYNELGSSTGITGFKPCSMDQFPFQKDEFGGLR